MITIARISKDPQIRMAELLDAAQALFYEQGYHQTAISDIVKKIGVAQGTFYYYFKSKEEILGALISRQISKIISEIQDITTSDNITPPRKIELTIQSALHTMRFKERLLFDFLYDDQHLHIKDKLWRQSKKVLAPSVLKIIVEGNREHYFNVFHPEIALDFLLAIVECLFDSMYDKPSPELLSHQFKMAEDLIQKTLGASEGTLYLKKI